MVKGYLQTGPIFPGRPFHDGRRGWPYPSGSGDEVTHIVSTQKHSLVISEVDGTPSVSQGGPPQVTWHVVRNEDLTVADSHEGFPPLFRQNSFGSEPNIGDMPSLGSPVIVNTDGWTNIAFLSIDSPEVRLIGVSIRESDGLLFHWDHATRGFATWDESNNLDAPLYTLNNLEAVDDMVFGRARLTSATWPYSYYLFAAKIAYNGTAPSGTATVTGKDVSNYSTMEFEGVGSFYVAVGTDDLSGPLPQHEAFTVKSDGSTGASVALAQAEGITLWNYDLVEVSGGVLLSQWEHTEHEGTGDPIMPFDIPIKVNSFTSMEALPLRDWTLENWPGAVRLSSNGKVASWACSIYRDLGVEGFEYDFRTRTATLDSEDWVEHGVGVLEHDDSSVEPARGESFGVVNLFDFGDATYRWADPISPTVMVGPKDARLATSELGGTNTIQVASVYRPYWMAGMDDDGLITVSGDGPHSGAMTLRSWHVAGDGSLSERASVSMNDAVAGGGGRHPWTRPVQLSSNLFVIRSTQTLYVMDRDLQVVGSTSAPDINIEEGNSTSVAGGAIAVDASTGHVFSMAGTTDVGFSNYFSVFDCSTPSSPTLLDKQLRYLPFTAFDMDYRDDMVAISGGMREGTQLDSPNRFDHDYAYLMDVGNRSSPSFVARVQGADNPNSAEIGPTSCALLSDNRLVITSRIDADNIFGTNPYDRFRLRFIDISDPFNPVVYGSVNLDGAALGGRVIDRVGDRVAMSSFPVRSEDAGGFGATMWDGSTLQYQLVGSAIPDIIGSRSHCCAIVGDRLYFDFYLEDRIMMWDGSSNFDVLSYADSSPWGTRTFMPTLTHQFFVLWDGASLIDFSISAGPDTRRMKYRRPL